MNQDVDQDHIDREKLLTMSLILVVIYNIMSLDRLDNIRIPKDLFLYKTHQQCGDLQPKLLWTVKRSDFVLLFLLTEKLRKNENQNNRHLIRARRILYFRNANDEVRKLVWILEAWLSAERLSRWFTLAKNNLTIWTTVRNTPQRMALRVTPSFLPPRRWSGLRKKIDRIMMKC